MLYKRNKLLLLVILLMGFNLSAQTPENPSKIKKEKATILLKNGSVIYGVLEQNDDIIVIKTKGGNVFAYPQTEIEKIDLNTKPDLGNGSYHQFGFGISHSETEFNGAFKIINGYQLASKIYFGAGIGIESYYERSYVPLTLEVQYHPFSHWDSQPYISADFGKLMLRKDENNGWLTGVKIGFLHPLGDKVSICTTVGVRHGAIERENSYYDWWGSNSLNSYRKYEINRLEFGLGFLIN